MLFPLFENITKFISLILLSFQSPIQVSQSKKITTENKEASWLYAELFVNDESLKNVNDEE